jgi:hypothetical protein
MGLVCEVIAGSMLFWTDEPEHAARVSPAEVANTAGMMVMILFTKYL